MPSDNPKRIIGVYPGLGETPTSPPVVLPKGSYDALVGLAMWGMRGNDVPTMPPSIESVGNQT